MAPRIKTRIERAELAVRNQSRFAAECICFPGNEQPFFHAPTEQDIAARVKCPLHGERFKRVDYFVYVAKWLREKRQSLLQTRHNEQYRKAWYASFPPMKGISTQDEGEE